MLGLEPRIQCLRRKTWMAGSGPAMTEVGRRQVAYRIYPAHPRPLRSPRHHIPAMIKKPSGPARIQPVDHREQARSGLFRALYVEPHAAEQARERCVDGPRWSAMHTTSNM